MCCGEPSRFCLVLEQVCSISLDDSLAYCFAFAIKTVIDSWELQSASIFIITEVVQYDEALLVLLFRFLIYFLKAHRQITQLTIYAGDWSLLDCDSSLMNGEITCNNLSKRFPLIDHLDLKYAIFNKTFCIVLN